MELVWTTYNGSRVSQPTGTGALHSPVAAPAVGPFLSPATTVSTKGGQHQRPGSRPRRQRGGLGGPEPGAGSGGPTGAHAESSCGPEGGTRTLTSAASLRRFCRGLRLSEGSGQREALTTPPAKRACLRGRHVAAIFLFRLLSSAFEPRMSMPTQPLGTPTLT